MTKPITYGAWSGTNYLGNRVESDRLAELIRSYWTDKGYSVQTKVVELLVPAGKAPVYMIRSDMVNGLPRTPAVRLAA